MANTTVKIKPYKAPFLFPSINEWWAYVTVTPDDNNNQLYLIKIDRFFSITIRRYITLCA